MGECCQGDEDDRFRLYEAECFDRRNGLYRNSAGEWQALRHLKCKGALNKDFVALAEQDLRESECFHAAISVWHSDCWSPITYDAELFKFLLVLYVSTRAYEFMSACLPISPDELNRLISFGQDLLSCSLEFSGFPDETRAFDFLEDTWKRHCFPNASLTTLSEIAQKVSHSLYFVSYPKRHEGPACATALSAIRDRIHQLESGSMDEATDAQLLVELKGLEREMVDCYKNEELKLSQGVWEEYFKLSLETYSCGEDPEAYELGWGRFTVSQLKRLLFVCSLSSLAASLFTQRPPKSVFLSHLVALYFCATHARLWLLNYWLPIYSEFRDLTYAVLGREDADTVVGQGHLDEAKALDSESGFQERVPSYVESLLRRDALFENETYLSQGCGKGLVFNLRNPICSRLKVPRYIKTAQDTDILEHSHDELALGMHSTLWYDTKVRYWLRVGECGANDAAAEAYSNTDKFLEWRAEWTQKKHSSPPATDVPFLA